MSGHKENSADKFSDFEPEVDDAVIDKGWEKIKYFLPQEKKKRAFLFFRTPGYGLLFVLCLSVLGFGIAGMLLQVYKTEEKIRSIENAVKHSDDKPSGRRTVNTLKAHKQQKSENKHTAAQDQFMANVDRSPVITGKNTADKNNESEHKNVPDLTVRTDQVKLTDTPAPDQQAVVVTQETDPGNNGQLDVLAYLKLEPRTVNRISENQQELIQVSLLLPADTVPQKAVQRKWSIELFGGLNQPDTRIKYEDNSLTPAKTMHFSIGLAAAWRFKNRWSFSALARLNGNRLNDTHETEGNKVVGKQAVIQTAGTPLVFNRDTAFFYKQVQSVSQIHASLNYNVCIGLGYTLLQKKKISLEALLGLSLKYASYQFSNHNNEGADTLKFTLTASSGPPPRQVQAPEEYNNTYKSISWGLVPGLALGYQFNSRMLVVLRPSAFIQLSKNELLTGQRLYRLEQNNLFLDLGLRIKL